MSKSSSKTVMTKAQTADDILADLMNDLKEVDKTVIGFDSSLVSEDSLDLDSPEATVMSAPDNLDLDVDAGVSSDQLLPGLSELNTHEHNTDILSGLSVSFSHRDEEQNLSSHFNDEFSQQNAEASEVKTDDEKTTIFSDVNLSNALPEDSKFSQVVVETNDDIQIKNPSYKDETIEQVLNQSNSLVNDFNQGVSELFKSDFSNDALSLDKTQIVQAESLSVSLGLNSALDALNKKNLEIESHQPKEPSLFSDSYDSASEIESISFEQKAQNENKTQVLSHDAEVQLPQNNLLTTDQEDVLGSENTQDFFIQKPTEDLSEKNKYDSKYDQLNSEKTVAVAGFAQKRNEESLDEKIKISVGQVRGQALSNGYASWGTVDSNLVQAENLKIAQEKILALESENEKLRQQNDDLISASEIVKERADLLNGQLYEFKNDREFLEQSFKNELSILKKQLERKENELQKALSKVEDLDSKIKFDLKKIRVRERELENRLELVRAEKNALMKSKDEQILDLKRKLDQVQLEVESYRQKCVDLNKVIETNQESFKRTIRALRLAMANLELQEESKTPLKKAE